MSTGLDFFVHKDKASAVLGCRPVSSRLISIAREQLLSIPTSYRFIHQHLVMMTVRSTTSTSNSRKP